LWTGVTSARHLLVCTLPLHAALPICRRLLGGGVPAAGHDAAPARGDAGGTGSATDALSHTATDGGRRPADRSVPKSGARCPAPRSEEHTSELQSRENLVCRLLLANNK